MVDFNFSLALMAFAVGVFLEFFILINSLTAELVSPLIVLSSVLLNFAVITQGVYERVEKELKHHF